MGALIAPAYQTITNGQFLILKDNIETEIEKKIRTHQLT
jgi:hypothetical protein